MHSLKAFKIKSRVKLELAAICPHQWKQNRGLLKTAAEKGQDGFSRWSLIAETHSLHPQCTLLSLFHTHLPSRNTAQGHRALRAVRTSVNGAHASCGPHTHTHTRTRGWPKNPNGDQKWQKGRLKKETWTGWKTFLPDYLRLIYGPDDYGSYEKMHILHSGSRDWFWSRWYISLEEGDDCEAIGTRKVAWSLKTDPAVTFDG